MLKRLGLLLAALLGMICHPAFADSKIFVASSLVDVVDALFEASNIDGLTIVVGSSSSLARQIKAGAPAGLFISANKDWAQYVADNKELQPLFSNRLVLISHEQRSVADIAQLPELLNEGRLAVADPDHVPAGIYARQALKSLSVWQSLHHRLAPADNVRAAAQLVSAGAAPFGIVYQSDAQLLQLNVAYEFSADTHMPIIYWMVAMGYDQPEVGAFVSFLGSEEARDIVASYGFVPLEGQ